MPFPWGPDVVKDATLANVRALYPRDPSGGSDMTVDTVYAIIRDNQMSGFGLAGVDQTDDYIYVRMNWGRFA